MFMEGANDHQKCRIVPNYANDKGTHEKDTGNHAQKDEYKAMLNDSSISDLYQHFLEPVAFVQVPVEKIQPSENPI